MNMLLKFILLSALCSPAWAAEVKLDKIRIATDIPAIEQGAEDMMASCHGCHSMKYLKYHDLIRFGISKHKVDGWRGDQPLDAPLLAQMSESDAMQSFGKAPPDLSLITKAREGGADYVYSYLLAYYTAQDGMPGNHVFPETRMPDPLGISGVTDEAQHAAIQTQAHDIVSFLSWAADPHAGERKRLGYYVIAYLFVLTGLLYLLKNQIWSRLK